jgi:hypothetical protein
MEWLSGSAVVAAVGSTLALVQVDTTHPDLMCEVVQLPQFHTDCIRELAINPANTVRSLATGKFTSSCQCILLLLLLVPAEGHHGCMCQ